MEIGVIAFKVMILFFCWISSLSLALLDFGAGIGNNYGLNG
jgi:hypothetical protein